MRAFETDIDELARSQCVTLLRKAITAVASLPMGELVAFRRLPMAVMVVVVVVVVVAVAGPQVTIESRATLMLSFYSDGRASGWTWPQCADERHRFSN